MEFKTVIVIEHNGKKYEIDKKFVDEINNTVKIDNEIVPFNLEDIEIKVKFDLNVKDFTLREL